MRHYRVLGTDLPGLGIYSKGIRAATIAVSKSLIGEVKSVSWNTKKQCGYIEVLEDGEEKLYIVVR